MKKINKIAVISDPQIDFKNIENGNDIEILQECLKNINVDFLAVCGDITQNALPQELDAFFDTFKQYCLTEKLFIVPGNEDGVYTTNGQNAYFEAYERFSGIKLTTLFSVQETENCFLIGISPEPINNGTVTDEQLDFIDNALRKASECGVPAFIFSHYQLTETINIDWRHAALNSDSPKIKPILEKYGGKVIFFSGHIHRGLIKENGGSIITKGNVTYISTPSLCKPDIKHYKTDNDNKGTGYIVYIDKDSVNIRGYDFLNNEFLADFDWTL